MSDRSLEPSSDGMHLIREWHHAKEHVSKLKKQLEAAEDVAALAEDRLVKWMVPNDVRKGEVICIWVGDSLLRVTTQETTPLKGTVDWRWMGPKLMERM